MNRYHLTTIITSLFTLLILPLSVLAQETTEDVDRELIKQKLKERLEDVNGVEDASESADAKTSGQNQYYAYFGLIEEATGSSMLIKADEGSTKKVSIAKDAEISQVTKSRATSITIEDIEAGQFVIAMGTMGNNKTLNATRISISQPAATTTKRQVVHGKITEIDADTINISNSSNFQIEIPKAYTILIQGVEDPELDDVSINDKAIAIVEAEPDEDDKAKTIYTLKSIYISPSINNPLAETNQIIQTEPAADATKAADQQDDSQNQN